MKVFLGATVHYRGKEGLFAPRAAIVTATTDSLDPRGVESGGVPALDSDDHVHLWVFTPSENGGFAEYNVPRGEAATEGEPPAEGEEPAEGEQITEGEPPAEVQEPTVGTIPPGTWCWPTLAAEHDATEDPAEPVAELDPAEPVAELDH